MTDDIAEWCSSINGDVGDGLKQRRETIRLEGDLDRGFPNGLVDLADRDAKLTGDRANAGTALAQRDALGVPAAPFTKTRAVPAYAFPAIGPRHHC